MKIKWSEPSLLDLEGIQEYIARDSEYYASRFIMKIIEAAEVLENFPEIGRLVPEADQENIREILFRNYRIIYRIEPKRVLILTILQGGRDLKQRDPKPWEMS
jgi:plasmid stabilization system protein ParE